MLFLPHHGVIKENSNTTKLRTVFNASAKANKRFSLNDFLAVGSNLLPEIVDLVSKWCGYTCVFTADVEKMFRQIWVHEDDQKLQAIVWREEESERIRSYFLTTVAFGFNCAPLLASRTLKQLAQDEGKNYPLARQILDREVYMDDILSGAHSLNQARAKQEPINDLL